MDNRMLDIIVQLYKKKLRFDSKLLGMTERENAKSYIDVLENARQEVMKTKNKELEKLYKEFFYDLYVIKEYDIPYSVYETEARLAKERGYGDIPITEEYIKQKNEQIIQDQKESLDKW